MKIKSGDTLSQIAKDKGLTLKALLAANPSIKNANQIRVGQEIIIPPKAISGGASSDNLYASMTRSEMKALSDDTASNRKRLKAGKQANEFMGLEGKKRKFDKARARAATRNAQLRATKEKHNKS